MEDITRALKSRELAAVQDLSIFRQFIEGCSSRKGESYDLCNW